MERCDECNVDAGLIMTGCYACVSRDGRAEDREGAESPALAGSEAAAVRLAHLPNL